MPDPVSLDNPTQRVIIDQGQWLRPERLWCSANADCPFFLEDGRRHLLLGDMIEV